MLLYTSPQKPLPLESGAQNRGWGEQGWCGTWQGEGEVCGKKQQTLDHKPKLNQVKAASLPAPSPQQPAPGSGGSCFGYSRKDWAMYSVGRGKEGRKYIIKCGGWLGDNLEACKISEFADSPLHPVIQAVNPYRKILSLLTQKRREEDGAGQQVLSHFQGKRCCHGPSLAPSPLCQLLPPNTYLWVGDEFE